MKNLWQRYTNHAMAFLLTYCFIAVSISSYILWFILPMGTGMHGENLEHCVLDGLGPTGNYIFVFGFPRYSWVDIHSWLSIGFMVIIIVHLLLHWRWILETIKRTKNYLSKKMWYTLERYSTVVILFILFIFQAISGFVVWLILPRGVLDYYNMKNDISATFLGLQRNEWVDLHAWVAVAALAVVIIHIIIHWRWVVNMFFGKGFNNDSRVNSNLERSYKGPVLEEPCVLVGKAEKNSLISAVNYRNELPKTGDGKKPGYMKRLGLYFGLFGVISFTVLITMLTVAAGRSDILWIIVPCAFISVLIAWKKPLPGGLLMMVLSAISISINTDTADIIGYSRYIPGLEFVYTVFFVSIPLIISAICLFLSMRKIEQDKLPGI